MAWTEQMVEDLKKMWDEGLTTGEIGKRLNVSKNSIVGKVHRLQLPARPSPIKKKDSGEDTAEIPAAKTAKAEPAPKEKEHKTVAPAPRQSLIRKLCGNGLKPFEIPFMSNIPKANIKPCSPTWTTTLAAGRSATPKTKTFISAAAKSKSGRLTAKNTPLLLMLKPPVRNRLCKLLTNSVLI